MANSKPKNPIALTGAQRRALRALGHHLKPVVQIGQHGISAGVIEATERALVQHELIKISIGRDAPVERKEAPAALGEATGSHVAQVIGRTALLYRRRHDEPEVHLPGSFEECPRPKSTKGADRAAAREEAQ
jgi:RNA-binding protein